MRIARPSISRAAAVLVGMIAVGACPISESRAEEPRTLDRVLLVAEVGRQAFIGETICDRGRRCPLDIGHLDLARAVERYGFSAELDGTVPTRPLLRIGDGEIALQFEGDLHRQIPAWTNGRTTCASIRAGRSSGTDGLVQHPILRSAPPIGWICIHAEAFDPPG